MELSADRCVAGEGITGEGITPSNYFKSFIEACCCQMISII